MRNNPLDIPTLRNPKIKSGMCSNKPIEIIKPKPIEFVGPIIGNKANNPTPYLTEKGIRYESV